MKIAVITCYFDPDYVRSRTIRSAVRSYPGAQLLVVKNSHKGLLRYPEVVWKLIQLRRRQNPDVYILTFRGQELLPFVLLIAGLRPVIFDEFIIPIAYATGEHHRRNLSSLIKHSLARLSEPFYRRWLRHCKFILADTEAHAELSARTSRLNLRQYRAVPVGTDETIFTPTEETKPALAAKPFIVFFYGLLMTPLHGLDVILEAARQLKNDADISFHIVGGDSHTANHIKALVADGVHLEYDRWIPFNGLAEAINEAAICIGGPLGGTPQAQHVITGKEYQFLACAAPTIVGQSEATNQYFIDKENALVVPQADPAALVKALRWAATHRSELVDIGRNGRRLYEREFSSQVIAADLKNLLDEVVQL